MVTFEDLIHTYYDERISTLGKIKIHSLGANKLVLAALRVLIYAQLEGGIKDLVACVIKRVNNLGIPLSDIQPSLIQWRNPEDINQFKAILNFENIVSSQSPFISLLNKPAKIKAINRKYEMNQMGWDTLKNIYAGIGLSLGNLEKSKAEIDQIVEDRNQTAHYGVLPIIASRLSETHLRDNAMLVEKVLTGISIQLLGYFNNNLHRRSLEIKIVSKSGVLT